MVDDNLKLADANPQYDRLLFVAALLYYCLNVSTIVITGPMRVLEDYEMSLFLFWIYCAPPWAAFVMCFIQAVCPKRPFTWFAFGAFVVFLGRAAYLTYRSAQENHLSHELFLMSIPRPL